VGRFFVDRPVFATVIAIVIVLLGLLALTGLPVAQYPDVVPPTVVVRATYPGADAATVAESVATPIEQEINGVEDMLYMSSQSTDDGSMTLTVTFAVGTDLDIAQVLVQNRLASATPRLPEPVRALGITTVKSSPDLLLVVHLLSPDEIEPALAGDLRLHDIETGQSQEMTLTPTLRQLYRQHFETWRSALEGYCFARDMNYLTLETSLAFDAVMLGYLRERGFVR